MKFYAHVGRPRPTHVDCKAVPRKAAHDHFAMLLHSKKERVPMRYTFFLFTGLFVHLFNIHDKPFDQNPETVKFSRIDAVTQLIHK